MSYGLWSIPTTIFPLGWSDFLISLDCSQNKYYGKVIPPSHVKQTDNFLTAQIITNYGGLNKNGPCRLFYLNSWSLGSGSP